MQKAFERQDFERQLNPIAKDILHLLTTGGFEAAVVGGTVRDFFLGVENHDVDMATDALPQDMMRLLKGYRLIETGAKFGTIRALKAGYEVEITTYRKDVGYSNMRHPDAVFFTPSLEEDLARRDFTINAMAWVKDRGFVDLYGGRSDLANKVLRTVGDPDLRFSEDALRILRAARFGSRLSLTPDPALLASANRKAFLIKEISAERIATELSLMLLHDKPSEAIRWLDRLGVLEIILPEVHRMKAFDQHSSNHPYDLYDHTLLTLDHTPPNLHTRWAALLHDVGKIDCFFLGEDGEGHFYGHQEHSKQMALYILTRLRYPNKDIEKILTLIVRHMDCMNIYTTKSVRRLMGRIGQEALFKLFDLQEADIRATATPDNLENIENARLLAKEIIETGAVTTTSQLAITGHDLMALGLKEGPDIGFWLKRLTSLVVDEALENEKNLLLEYVTQEIKRSING